MRSASWLGAAEEAADGLGHEFGHGPVPTRRPVRRRRAGDEGLSANHADETRGVLQEPGGRGQLITACVEADGEAAPVGMRSLAPRTALQIAIPSNFWAMSGA